MCEQYKFFKTTTNPVHGTITWEVSNFGNIRKNGEKYEIKKPKNGKGLLQFAGVYLHKIVAELFVPNPDNKPEVDHIDTNIYNNNVSNLRWVTRKENLSNPLTRKHMKEAQIGRKWTDESKLKASMSHKGRQAWNKGKTGIFNEEALKKISANSHNAMLGRVLSEETKRKISESVKKYYKEKYNNANNE